MEKSWKNAYEKVWEPFTDQSVTIINACNISS